VYGGQGGYVGPFIPFVRLGPCLNHTEQDIYVLAVSDPNSAGGP
jgi:hypothetical protein